MNFAFTSSVASERIIPKDTPKQPLDYMKQKEKENY